MSRRPFWKNAVNRFEEWLTMRTLRITYGKGLYFRSEENWANLLFDVGLQVQTLRLDAGYIHPHILLIGEKP